jgi:hypothetical protein
MLVLPAAAAAAYVYLQMQQIVSQGQLLPDDVIIEVRQQQQQQRAREWHTLSLHLVCCPGLAQADMLAPGLRTGMMAGCSNSNSSSSSNHPVNQLSMDASHIWPATFDQHSWSGLAVPDSSCLLAPQPCSSHAAAEGFYNPTTKQTSCCCCLASALA